jgi:hypothetical protein
MSSEERIKLQDDYNSNTFMHEELNNCPIDFVKNFINGVFIFLTPECINLQAFAGPSSTETRFIGSDLTTFKEMNIEEYNNKIFYYNQYPRQFGWHDLPGGYLNRKLGVDRCGDCALMYHILSRYYNKHQPPGAMCQDILRLINRHLFCGNHGKYYNKLIFNSCK